MNELNQDIDHLFQEMVEPSEMQPSQMVWTSIDKKLNDKQQAKMHRKYKRILNFSIGMSLMVISLLYLIFNQNTKKKELINKGTIENTQTAAITDNATETPVASIVTNNNPINNTNKMATNKAVNSTTNNGLVKENTSANGNPNEIILNADNNNAVSKSDSPIITTDNNKTENNQPPVTANNAVEQQGAFTAAAINPEINNKEVGNTEKLTTATTTELPDNTKTEPAITPAVADNNTTTLKSSAEENNTTITPVVANEAKENAIEPVLQNDIKTEPLTTNEEILKSATTIEQQEAQTQAQPVATIEKVDSAKTESVIPDSTITSATDFNNPPKTDSLWKDYKFFVGAFYSPDDVRMKPNYINGDGNRFIEQAKYSYSTGINAGYQITKHWSVTTSVVYSTISSSFDFNRSITSGKVTTDCSWFTAYGIVTMPVTNSTISETCIPVKYTSKINVNGIEKVKYVSVPVEGQYKIGKKQLSGFVSLGFAANFLVSHKATINDLVSGVQYTSNISGLKKTYFSGAIGLGVQYRMWQRISVFLEPTYRKSITQVGTDDLPYKTKLSVFGLNGGLNFLF
jgi:Outer membrane protein beta-barrel domain